MLLNYYTSFKLINFYEIIHLHIKISYFNKLVHLLTPKLTKHSLTMAPRSKKTKHTEEVVEETVDVLEDVVEEGVPKKAPRKRTKKVTKEEVVEEEAAPVTKPKKSRKAKSQPQENEEEVVEEEPPKPKVKSKRTFELINLETRSLSGNYTAYQPGPCGGKAATQVAQRFRRAGEPVPDVITVVIRERSGRAKKSDKITAGLFAYNVTRTKTKYPSVIEACHKIWERDEDGRIIKGEDGKPILKEKKPSLNKKDYPDQTIMKQVAVLDASGNPKKDKDGKVVTKSKKVVITNRKGEQKRVVRYYKNDPKNIPIPQEYLDLLEEMSIKELRANGKPKKDDDSEPEEVVDTVNPPVEEEPESAPAKKSRSRKKSTKA